ncbi:MAG TPA: sulfatase-like hydrolase/transferase [Bryobacteraceae bacterium]|nr:sulfatase-like hydrolase/transferase [Bryobacteraceae bacterium]
MALERRDILKLLGTAAVSPLTASSSESPSAKPNILVFLTDDHGQWLQQAYGNSEVRTPNMTRIARNGVRMTNAFTTSPVCSPARASFFTGRMPSQHGIHDWIEETKQAYAYPWLKGQTLISQLLKESGYHTGLVGKWHCGEERYPHPGFDSWFSYWVSQYPHSGRQNFSDNGKHITADGFQSPFLTEQAIRFLKNHYAGKDTADKPFFLFVGYTDTHSPHEQMPDDLVAGYAEATFRDIPREPFPSVHGRALIPVSNDPEKERRKREEYYAAASSIDTEVGKALDALESLGQMDNTIVIYTGDHGLNAGHHGMWEKGNATIPQNFFEESIRVPCSIAWRNGGIPQGLESDLPVNHCDLFATLLEAAGATPHRDAAERINSPGRSYLPHLLGKSTEPWRDDVVCEYGNARMMRHDGYKLILRYPYGGVEFANEFYDLRADPRETTNLYEKPEYKKAIQQMTARTDGFFAKYRDPAHDGLRLQDQPLATPASPWLQALKSKTKG